jgi:hypothetical protein
MWGILRLILALTVVIFHSTFLSGATSHFVTPAHMSVEMFFTISGFVITTQKRNSAQAQCTRGASLIRRELFYPGWHAQVNGHAVAVSKAAPLFQQINLPAGQSKIRFFYRPPFERRACAAAALDLLLWLGLLVYVARGFIRS